MHKFKIVLWPILLGLFFIHLGLPSGIPREVFVFLGFFILLLGILQNVWNWFSENKRDN